MRMLCGVAASPAHCRRALSCLRQALMVILINVPAVSFGLALGWVSVASGEGGVGSGAGSAEEEQVSSGEVVVAAATTFAATVVGVPLSASLLAAGRKTALIATSGAFVLCWSLKLVGTGWWLVAARIAAGVGGAGAWVVSPLLAGEMCSDAIRGAAVSALVLAHNLGNLLMYLAADARLPIRTVLWWCLGLSACHCVVFLFVPESPTFLASKGKSKEARSSLAWLRGARREDPVLEEEVAKLPPPDATDFSAFKHAKEMLSDCGRRRAFIIACIAVCGQEMCGVLALLQFAERVFVLARPSPVPIAPASLLPASTVSAPIEPASFLSASIVPVPMDGELATPARYAVILGAVQLVSSIIALYLVERVGRRPLIVSTAVLTAVFLGAGACVVVWGGGAGGGAWGAAALAAAVAADSAGLQPAPYALLADMFHNQYGSCAVLLAMSAGALGNLLEMALFPATAAGGGLGAALALSSLLTLAYAVFAALAVPETRGRTPEDIYRELCTHDHEKQTSSTEQCDKVTVCTNM